MGGAGVCCGLLAGVVAMVMQSFRGQVSTFGGGVGVVGERSDRDAERNRAGDNNKEVKGDQRVRRWKHLGVMKLQRVFPAKSVVGVGSSLAKSEKFAERIEK
jgi:hypothetical protein